jgi:EAL domain-containing protein (putative c-di-GMP-specific phosphodiesterase class I)/GGDEF domain-containing protein
MTGLPSRSLLQDRLTQALAFSARTGQATVAGYVAVDNADGYDSTPPARALQQAVAQRLADDLLGGDTVARVGEGEFVMLWPGVSTEEEAQALGRRCTDLFLTPFQLDEVAAPVRVSISLGLAVSRPSDSADSLLLTARQTLFDARSARRRDTNGRPDNDLGAGGREPSAASSLIARLRRGDFVLHYQPVVDVERQVVTAVEALVRLRGPEGLRMPDSFIRQAEASGFIVPLGAWVIDEACRQGAEWLERGLELDVAVNLSARQVCHPDVVATITGSLDRSGLPPHRLLVEITESTMMEDADIALTTLRRIAATGARIAIDDFGTGYSSLVYLKQYPFQVLKIDRSFIAGMGHHRSDDAIVASVVGLARAVGAECIAEGVETAEQLETLRAMGCKRAQGYLFGRPVPAAELPASVARCEAYLALTARLGSRTDDDSPAMPNVRTRILELQQAGASPLTIAAALNREGAEHPRNIRWHGSAVSRQLAAMTAGGHGMPSHMLEGAD